MSVASRHWTSIDLQPPSDGRWSSGERKRARRFRFSRPWRRGLLLETSVYCIYFASAGDILWVGISISGGRGLVVGRRNEEVRGRKRLCH